MEQYEPGDWTDAKRIGGMKPWACEYIGQDGHIYGITLYGSNADQVVEDNCDALSGLKVVGELVSTAPAVKRPE